MPHSSNRRWIFTILLAVLFPAIAFHVSCVAALGPGSWGSGLEEKLPRIVPASSNPRALGYASQLRDQMAGADDKPSLPAGLTGISGEVSRSDHLTQDHMNEQGLWVIQTHDGDHWPDRQHLYLWRQASDLRPQGATQLEELDVPSDRIIDHPLFAKTGDGTVLVYGWWNSWALSPAGKLGRYVRSWLEPTLRPEYSFFVYDLQTKTHRYWGPGHTLVVSPDRTRGALLRSGALRLGYCSLHVWDFTTGAVETVLSLREADPGSGRSFDYRWSNDSQALFITGETGGFERRKPGRRAINLIHLPGDPLIYEAP